MSRRTLKPGTRAYAQHRAELEHAAITARNQFAARPHLRALDALDAQLTDAERTLAAHLAPWDSEADVARIKASLNSTPVVRKTAADLDLEALEAEEHDMREIDRRRVDDLPFVPKGDL